MDSQMKRGVLEMCLLYQLFLSDYYGYDLINKMKKYFSDVNDSTFYAILRRSQAENLTEIYYGQDSKGPQRKYYKLTQNGIEYLKQEIEDWEKLKEIVESLGISDFGILDSKL